MAEPLRFDEGWCWDDPRGLTWDGFAPETSNPNPMNNEFNGEMSDADQTAALANITDLNTLLTFLVALTLEQKKHLNAAAKERVPFIQQAAMFLQQHPEVMAGTFDKTKFDKKVNWLNKFFPVLQAHDAQNQKMHETLAFGSSDIYGSALEIYHSFERANKGGEYNTVVAALKAYFEAMGIHAKKQQQAPN